jgi:hypothetical protein
VIFNPPIRKMHEEGDLPGEAAIRWFAPEPLVALADRLRAEGKRVLILDAPARRLDEQEAEERVRGTEPVAVIYNGAEGGMERLRSSARRMKLLGPTSMQCILVGAGSFVPLSEYARYPMFDQIHAGFPAAEALLGDAK